jgi:folate-binding protein YgfZ
MALGALPRVEPPSDYGNALAEQDLVRRAVGLIDEASRGILDLRGKDAAVHLERLLSSRVKDLAPGRGQPSCLLSAKGRLVAAFHLWALPAGERADFRLVFSEPLDDGAVKALERYTFLADLETVRRGLDDPEGLGPAILSLQGPLAERVLREAAPGAVVPAARGELATFPWPAAAAPVAVSVVRGGATPEGGLELWVPLPTFDLVWQGLLAASRAAGGGPVGRAACEALRIEAGLARAGTDYDRESFPNEVGWERALTYDKCYVGQEVVARMRTYGEVHRRLKGLILPGLDLPPAGAPVRAGGETIGVVTSAAVSARLGRALALALIKRRFWEVRRATIPREGGGTVAGAASSEAAGADVEVDVEVGVEVGVDVVDLPFVPTAGAP